MPGPRLKVEPGDVPPEKAARRLGLSLAEFDARKYALFDRGFPRPDETTGLYDLGAIEEWRRRRHPQLYPAPLPLTGADKPRDAREVARDRLARLG